MNQPDCTILIDKYQSACTGGLL